MNALSKYVANIVRLQEHKKQNHENCITMEKSKILKHLIRQSIDLACILDVLLIINTSFIFCLRIHIKTKTHEKLSPR